MPKITANGIQLHYEWHGPDDGEVLVLSNGILMSTASWVFQTQVLSRYYRLLLYDCRGMWQSDHPAGPYTMDLHADDLAALLDAFDVEQAHIGGTSYGAEISMLFALRYPERTWSLIVTTAVSEIQPLLAAHVDNWIAAARAKDAERLFQAVYPLTFSEAWIAANRALLEEARQRYKTLDFDAFLELLLCFSSLDITADLHKITVPTMIIAAELDILKPQHYSEIIAREIPNSEFAIIPNSGHAALWEQAGVFNSLIMGFLAKQVTGVKL